MKVSLIAAVYKDIEALDAIVRALKDQTYKNFELVVAEDNDSAEMKVYIASIEGIEVKHTFQEDKGVRKSRSVNNAILESSGEYLIFIDGDCVPQSHFIESHVTLSEKGKVLSGRRFNLGAGLSDRLRKNTLSARQLEKGLLWYLPAMLRDDTSHIEQGIYLNPKGFLFPLLQKRKSNISLLGCNYSCYKSDMVEINGLDEIYGPSPLSDDTDLQWRFEARGYPMKSCKFAANVYHLFHTRKEHPPSDEEPQELTLMNERKADGKFFAAKGLDSH